MPKRTLERRKVFINDETKQIIAFYEDSLKKLTTEVDALNVGEAKLAKGLSTYLKSLIEKIFEKKINAAQSELPLIEVELDPPGEAMLSGYITFLSGILKNEDKISSEEIVKSDIKNPLVLVYELLIRFALIALDTGTGLNKLGRDGEDILKLIQIFIKQINDTDILTTGFLKSESNLSKKLNSSTHHKWIGFLSAVIKATKTLHSNSTALNGTIEYLSNTEQAIIMHIIAELAPNTKKDDLHPHLLKNTFANVHKAIISDIGDKNTVRAMQRKRASEQEIIIAFIKPDELSEFFSRKKMLKKQNRLINLYKYLEYTSQLKEITDGFNLFNIIGGWILILADVLNINELANRIQKLGKECTELLEYDDSSAIYKRPIQKGLKVYDESSYLLTISQQVFNGLGELMDETQKNTIAKFAIGCFGRLNDLGKKLNCNFINVKQFQLVMGVAFPGTNAPVIKKTPQSKIEFPAISDSNSTLPSLSDTSLKEALIQKPGKAEVNKAEEDDTEMEAFSADKEGDNNLPPGLTCPLTKEIMTKPMFLVADGETYEEKAILAYLIKYGTSPTTKEKISEEERVLYLNKSIKKQIDAYLKNISQEGQSSLSNITILSDSSVKNKLLEDISTKVIDNLLNNPYKKELRAFEYSKRKFKDNGEGELLKEGLKSQLLNQLKNKLSSFDEKFIKLIQDELNKQLILALSLKLNDSQNNEKAFFDKKGVLGRNAPWGISDPVIMFDNLEKRVSLALSFTPQDQKEIDLKSLTDYVSIHLLDKNDELKKAKFSRRKIGPKTMLSNLLFAELKSRMDDNFYAAMQKDLAEIQQNLIYAISIKLADAKSNESFILFKNSSMIKFGNNPFETKGVLLRNLLGKEDYDIVIESLSKRVDKFIEACKDPGYFKRLDLDEDNEEQAPLLTIEQKSK